MKKLYTLMLLVFIAASLITGCGNDSKQPPAAQQTKTALKIGATAVPHAEILNAIKPVLAQEGINLEIIEFSDYVQPNLALADKELDANFFQHLPYLEKFVAERNLPLVSAVSVHIEPMGIYSHKIKDFSELKQGDVVAIPNDPTNSGRALAVLETAGLIKLNPGIGVNGTVKDIAENSRALKIRELDAAQLPRVLGDAAIAVINTNYALEADLNPSNDALAIEAGSSPYANVLAVRKGDEQRPEIVALAKALTSPTVKTFLAEKYRGAIVPVF